MARLPSPWWLCPSREVVVSGRLLTCVGLYAIGTEMARPRWGTIPSPVGVTRLGLGKRRPWSGLLCVAAAFQDVTMSGWSA